MDEPQTQAAIVQHLLEQHAALVTRTDAIERELKANTEVTAEVRDLLTTVKGGFKVLGWLGHGGKWMGMIAGAAVSIYTLVYALTHGGRLPPGQ
jgi:hypothetical protein